MVLNLLIKYEIVHTIWSQANKNKNYYMRGSLELSFRTFVAPNFFLMIFIVTKNLDPIMFANKANLLYSHKNIRTLFRIFNSKLKLVNEWILANKLSLYAKKTKYVLFHKVTMILSQCSCQPWHPITSKLKEKFLSKFYALWLMKT